MKKQRCNSVLSKARVLHFLLYNAKGFSQSAGWQRAPLALQRNGPADPLPRDAPTSTEVKQIGAQTATKKKREEEETDHLHTVVRSPYMLSNSICFAHSPAVLCSWMGKEKMGREREKERERERVYMEGDN